jgi:WD40 repeat protein
MPFAVRRGPALAALAAGLLSPLAAGFPIPRQPGPPAAEPSAADLKALADKFRAERAEAVAAKFPADALAPADELAGRAEAAVAAGNPRAAARYYRDARWHLPYLPPDLPPHVGRVLGDTRMRHPEPAGDQPRGVFSVAYSPDGTALASGSADGTAKVWDLATGRERVTYRGHADQSDDPTAGKNVLGVAAVAFHPKEAWVASAAGNQVHLWAADTGKPVKVLAKLDKAEFPLKSIAFSPDGRRLAAGGDDGVVRVFAVDTGKETFKSPARNARVERVAFSRDGKRVAAADANGAAAVYAPGAANPVPLNVTVVPAGACLGVAFAPDGAGLFTGGTDGRVRLIGAPGGAEGAGQPVGGVAREFAGHDRGINDLAVTPDGQFLVTAGDDKTVRVWDAKTAAPVRSFQGHLTKVLGVAVRPDGRQVASAGADGAIRLWDLRPADDHRALTGAAGPVWAAAVSPDGKRAAAAGADKVIRVYDPETGKLEATLTGHTAAVTALAFLPDSNRLVSAGGDRTVRVWDVAAGKQLKELTGHELPVLAVAVGPDGKRVVSGAADRTVRGWDTEAGKQLWSWAGKSAVTGVAVRPGGSQVAAGAADGGLVILDITGETPKELHAQTAHVAGVAAVAYSPDGSRLATAGGDGVLRVWAVGGDGRPAPLARFDGQPKPGTPAGMAPLAAAAFAPDGRHLASAGADGVVRVWDIPAKAEVRGLRGHPEWATAVAFAPDGRRLVAAGADGTVRVFELTPQEGSGRAGHLRAVNAVAVSPDGKTIATASADLTVKLWDRASGRERLTLLGGADDPFAVAFAGPDRVAAGGRADTQDAARPETRAAGRVHLWDLGPTPRLAAAVPAGQVNALAALPDGSRLGVWSARPAPGDEAWASTFEVLDRAGKVVASVADRGRNVRAAAFSPDLTLAAAGDETGTVRLWDLHKKERAGGDWPLFAQPVGDLGLTPDNKLLVAADANGLVKVADVARRETLGSVKAVTGGVRGLLVSPTGDTFVTLGADREVRAWSLADPADPKPVRAWPLPVGVNAAAYTPDGKQLVTANADGTAYVLDLP